jgi:hypothetical protein
LKKLSFTVILRKGYLRLKVKPPQEDYPEYYNLEGRDDEFGDNDDRSQEIMERFKKEVKGIDPEFVSRPSY